MKILHVIAQKPKDTGSGVYARNLINFFHKKGYEQGIIYGAENGDEFSLPTGVYLAPIIFNSTDLPFPIIGMSDTMPYPSSCYRKLDSNMITAWKNSFIDTLVKVRDEFKPDIIICHHLYLLTAITREIFTSTPIVGVCHASDIRQLKSHDLEKKYILQQISKLDRILSLHSIQGKEIEDTFSIKKDNIHIMGLAYNEKLFKVDNFIKRKKNSLWYIGKVSSSKGVNELIEACRGLPITLNIAGGISNSEGRSLISKGRDYISDINYHGLLSQERLSNLLRKGELLVLPSYYEGFPMVVIEALASGMKVVVNDLPGLRQGLGKLALSSNIYFVPMPKLATCDQIHPNYRDSYIKNLRNFIYKALSENSDLEGNLEDFTWNSLGNRFLNLLEDVFDSYKVW